MTLGALRVSAIALSAAAFVLSSPLSPADAATVAHPYRHAAHPRVSHGLHGHGLHGQGLHRYVAHGHAGHRHYVWRNGHRYVSGYGYNPGAAVAAGVIAGAAAGYPYCGDTSYGSYYGSCDDYSYDYPYPYYDYGYGYGGPVFVGGARFHHRFDHGFHRGFGFHGGGAHFTGGNVGHVGGFGAGQFGGGHFAGGNFGHAGGFGGGHVGGFGGGFGGGHVGGFGGGHMGGFGGGHVGGFGGGHFGGGGHFR
jgi:hypothetical protein